MTTFSIWQGIYLSFYSKPFYQDVAKRWGGKSIIYLLVILALTCIGATYEIQVNINRFYELSSSVLVPQIPTITLKGGEIQTPENKPYMITAPKSSQIIAIIDTSGQYQDIDKAQSIILFTKSNIITKNKNQIKIYHYPKNFDKTIVASEMNDAIKPFISYLFIPAFIFLWFGSFVLRFIQTMLYGIWGKFLNLFIRTQLNYWQIVQIAMVAITPTLIINTVLPFIYSGHIKLGLFSFLLTTVYIIYGMVVNKETHA